MGKSIGILSIKGGVGKTSVVSSLAAALANEFNQKVLVIDANFSAPNLALHLGVVNPEITIHHVLSGQVFSNDAVYKTDYGFELMPGALMYDEKINPFKLKERVNELKENYDIILIDSSPSLNSEILSAMLASDELYVVTTPDHVTMSTTLRAVHLAKKRNTPIKGLILNKVYNKKFELEMDEIEDTAECNVLAVLPHELGILEALSKTIPSTLYKETDSTIEYKKLAAALIGEHYEDKRFKSKILKLFNKIPKQETNRTIFMDENLHMLKEDKRT